MSYPAIVDAPDAPVRVQAGDEYAAVADAFAAYIASMPAMYNALADWFQDTAASLTSQGFSGTSVTSLTIGTGAKSLIASTGAAFVGGQAVVIASAANPANSMTGTVVSYDSETGEMDVNVTSVSGSGTFANWTIGLALVADLTGYLPLAGGTMTGLLTLAATLGLVLSPGSAPGSPVDGQSWRETGKLMHRLGATSFEVALLGRTQSDSNKTFSSSSWSGGTISGATVSSAAINGGTFTDYTEVGPSATTGAALSPNLANGTLFRLITNGNATITLPTPVAGKSFTVAVEYGGVHTLSWAGGTRKWVAGTAPTPTSVNGKIDVFTFICLDGSNWLAFVSGQNL
jgi:hypothetical protein